MRLLHFFFFALLVGSSLSCHLKTPSNLWFYTHSINNNTQNDSLLTPASFLSLQRDGTFTRDFGSFDYGKWIMKKDTIILINSAKQTTQLPVKYFDSKEMQVKTADAVTACFDAQPNRFKTRLENPFSLENNQWRIPASEKESEAVIKSRLINHCQFWIAYFTWAYNNSLEVVDVRSTPTPIKIYGNGFSIKPFEDLPKAWQSYFYDKEDCRIANNLLYETFQYHDISWAHTDNKYKMFIGAFEQLKQFLLRMKD